MKLKTSLNGKTYEFKSIADVLAKANEPKSADRFQGIAAETASERVAAKIRPLGDDGGGAHRTSHAAL